MPEAIGGLPIIANDLGYYKTNALDVTISKPADGASNISSITTGTFDIAQASTMDFISAFAKGAPVVAIYGATAWTTVAPCASLVTLKTTPLASLAPATAKFAVSDGTYGFESISMPYLTAADPAAYARVSSSNGLDAVAKSLRDKTYDAVLIGEPMATVLVSLGDDMIKADQPFRTLGAKLDITVWFTSLSNVLNDGQMIQAFRTSMNLAAAWANDKTNANAVDAILAKQSILLNRSAPVPYYATDDYDVWGSISTVGNAAAFRKVNSPIDPSRAAVQKVVAPVGGDRRF